MLNVGDKVFVGKYGAGIIRNIEERDFFGKISKYIIVFLFADEMDLFIPMEKIQYYNIRNICDEEIMERALNILKQKPKAIEKNWNKRYRKNSKKINSGSIYKICQVIRDLYYLKKEELLPPGEEKILQRAESMIVSELMLVYSISIDEAYKKIRSFHE